MKRYADCSDDIKKTARMIVDSYGSDGALLEGAIAAAIDSEREKRIALHRRAQKAEGAANAARFVVELWEKTLANDQRRIMFELTIRVLAEVRQALSRFPSNRGKP